MTEQTIAPPINMPIFPLPVFLLPAGITRLRIFEPRYLKMVKIASQAHGFAILYKSKSEQTPTWASWVEIINFDQQDGLLVIDIRCKSLVSLDNLTCDQDNLHFADTSPIEHWASQPHDEVTAQLTRSLTQLFEQHQDLQALYQYDVDYQNKTYGADWVIARWLELLPLEAKVKNIFTQQDSFEQAKTFLLSVIKEK